MGAKKDTKKIAKAKAPQEERGRWRQGQEEEVVQGKDPRQVEQPGSLRSGHIRQIGEGGTYVQARHPFHRQWKNEGPRVTCTKSSWELLEKGLIKQVVAHHAQHIYTRLIKDSSSP